MVRLERIARNGRRRLITGNLTCFRVAHMHCEHLSEGEMKMSSMQDICRTALSAPEYDVGAAQVPPACPGRPSFQPAAHHPLIEVVGGAKTSIACEFIAHCRRQLGSFKVPRRVEFSMTELPKRLSGKILKRI